MATRGERRAVPAGGFSLERRQGRLGPVTVVQVVVVELVAFAVAAAAATEHGRPQVRTAVAGTLGLFALIVFFTRSRGDWWYAQGLRRRRWRRRRAAARRAGPGADPQLATLSSLAPGFAVREVFDRDTRIGIGQDAGGWFAALAVHPDRGSPAVPLDRLARLLADSPVPMSSISVVSHTVPAPSVLLDRQVHAVQSYRELLGDDTVAAAQRTWVAVRLAPADASAAAASRGGGMAGVDRAVAAAVGRIGKALSAIDLSSRVLDRAALTAALAASFTPDASVPDEQWRLWYSGGLAHTGLWLSRWPDQGPAALFRALAGVPAALVSVAVTVLPPGAGGRYGVGCLVRVAAPPDSLARAVEEARTAAGRTGARLRRLDGDQAPVTYATAPTAAGVW